MQTHSRAASSCAALALIALCTLLSGCSSSSLNATDYDLAARECGDQFLSSLPEGQHVIIDPQLATHEYAPLTLRGVEKKLAQLEDKALGKLAFRVIAKQICEPATNTLRTYQQSSGTEPAQLLSPLMLEKAKRSDSFPDDNYVLILLTRYKDDVQSTSMETTCSPELSAAYPNLPILLSRSTTNNIPQRAQTYLPNPVDEAVLLVARELTAEVAKVEKEKAEAEATQRREQEEQQRIAEAEKKVQEERQKQAFDSAGLMIFITGLIVGILLTLLGLALFRFLRKNNTW